MKKIPTVEQLKRYFDRIIEIEKLPVTYERTRDGWAGYRSNEAYGKLRITGKHELGPFINGHGDCFARAGYDGLCPGHEHAAWLNSLGDDDATYMTICGHITTNGQVRANWLAYSNHIVAVDPELARLNAARQRTSADLRRINREIKRLTAAKKTV